jgi:hypothetical protein
LCDRLKMSVGGSSFDVVVVVAVSGDVDAAATVVFAAHVGRLKSDLFGFSSAIWESCVFETARTGSGCEIVMDEFLVFCGVLLFLPIRVMQLPFHSHSHSHSHSHIPDPDQHYENNQSFFHSHHTLYRLSIPMQCLLFTSSRYKVVLFMKCQSREFELYLAERTTNIIQTIDCITCRFETLRYMLYTNTGPSRWT